MSIFPWGAFNGARLRGDNHRRLAGVRIEGREYARILGIGFVAAMSVCALAGCAPTSIASDPPNVTSVRLRSEARMPSPGGAAIKARLDAECKPPVDALGDTWLDIEGSPNRNADNGQLCGRQAEASAPRRHRRHILAAPTHSAASQMAAPASLINRRDDNAR
jgi:hypothetical protein